MSAEALDGAAGTAAAWESLSAWCDREPSVDASMDVALREIHREIEHGEQLFDRLPPKPRRSAEEQLFADRILEHQRSLRRRVLDRHAEALYDRLTSGRRDHKRLFELVEDAALRFPGLLPSAEKMAMERGRAQAEKDGHEIDHGIFAAALLRSPVAGRHLVDAMRMPTHRARELFEPYRRGGEIELQRVHLERRGSAAHITLTNPGSLNAEDGALVRDLEVAVDLATLDDATGAMVLRGGEMTHPKYSGRRVFCAGIDLRALARGEISFVDFLLGRELGLVNKLRRGLLVEPSMPQRELAKPWLAVVDAFAIGGGMQLLLVADRVLAADDAFFSLPAADEGFVPGVANLRLGRWFGGRLARQILYDGRRIRASDPEASLLCDRVLPAGELDAAIESAAAQLDSPALLANRQMLHLAEESESDFRSYMATFAEIQAQRLHSPDVVAKLDARWLRAKDRTRP